MNNEKRIILIFVFSIVFFIVFVILDNGTDVDRIDQLIQPLIFTFAFITGTFFHSTRKYLLGVGIILLSLMIFTYLFVSLDVSDWIGSLGFGIFFTTIFTYIPEIIRKGYIERY